MRTEVDLSDAHFRPALLCIFDACPAAPTLQIHRPRKPRHRTPSALQIRRPCSAWYYARHSCIWRKTSTAGTRLRKQPTPRTRPRGSIFREGEVWWVRLGHNVGYEANGKSREFTRPVIILKKYNQYSFLALPLTTVPKPNPYRLPVGIVDGRQAFATLSQLRNIDSKRLVKKIMHLDADIFIAIKKEASRVNFG
jgi:mRNA interferase MazF